MSLVTWIALALASSKAVTHFCLSTSEEALKVTAVRTALPKGGPQTRNNDTMETGRRRLQITSPQLAFLSVSQIPM